MRKPKITIIGAGSTVFAKRLMGDILSFKELSNVTLSLFDINPERVSTSEIVAHKLCQTAGASATIEVPSDRRKALEESNYVICLIQVGGYQPGTVIDFEIPKKYGLRQTISDTLGIGGIMRGLRTVPVLLDICRDMEELCPDALFISYVNPMAINCWAVNRESRLKTIGLCHSVQGTAKQLAEVLCLPVEEMNYICAGINHMSFYLSLEHKGQDLYPQLRKAAEECRFPATERVRFEVFKKLGYFVTESSEHFSEYVPWFIKRDRPDLIERFNIPLDEYIRRSEDQISRWNTMKVELENAGTLEITPSGEYAPLIIHSMETGQLRMFNGNVPNHGLIQNLPEDCCVEVPCVVDRNGIQPVKVGAIPPQLAAVMRMNVNVQSLVVEAALTHRREHIYHAAMMDPHTAAELDLDQITSLVDDLIECHGNWLPAYN